MLYKTGPLGCQLTAWNMERRSIACLPSYIRPADARYPWFWRAVALPSIETRYSPSSSWYSLVVRWTGRDLSMLCSAVFGNSISTFQSISNLLWCAGLSTALQITLIETVLHHHEPGHVTGHDYHVDLFFCSGFPSQSLQSLANNILHVKIRMAWLAVRSEAVRSSTVSVRGESAGASEGCWTVIRPLGISAEPPQIPPTSRKRLVWIQLNWSSLLAFPFLFLQKGKEEEEKEKKGEIWF